MPGWGTGSFDNEEAQSWLAKLNTVSLDDLRRVFSAVDQAEYVEAGQASVAIAAAEAVAALKGEPAQPLPGAIENWLTKTVVPGAIDDAARTTLCAHARNAVGKVRANSELKDLWLEADGLNEWSAGLRDLETRLAG